MPAPAQTAADQALGKFTLRVHGPTGTMQTVVLSSACCRVGSGSGCTLRLRAPGIRDVHCVIFRGPRQTVVRGLAKETWLNGAVFFESPLCVGDRLQLGRLEIEVLTDERLGGAEPSDEFEAAIPNDSTLPPHTAAASEPSEPARAAGTASSAADEDRLAARDTSGHLKELVANQTAGMSPLAACDVPRSAAEEAASLVAGALQQIHGVEGRFGERLGGLEEHLHRLEQAVGDIRAGCAAREDEDRRWRAERQQAEAAWHHSVGDLEGRLQQLAAAGDPGTSSHGGGSEKMADWRQLDERLSVLERLVGHEDQQYAKTSQGLEELAARVGQAEAAIVQAETASQAVDARLAQVERLELRLAELACQHATSAEQGASLQTAFEQRRHEWSEQLAGLGEALGDLRRQTETLVDEFRRQAEAQSAAYDELQRRFAGLEAEWATAPQRTLAVAEEVEPHGRVAISDEPGATERETSAADTAASELEELTFEQVSKDAPLSTMDVLRRMGATVSFSEEDDSPAPRTPARPVPSHAERPKPTADAGPSERRGNHPEDGEAIEEYMSQLLQRMRSPKADDGTADRRAASAEPPAPRPAPAARETTVPAAKPAAPAPPSDVPPASGQFVPRALAPELTADFSAMRALANNTARQAIDTHHRSRQARFTRGKLAVAVLALVLSFALLWLSTGGSHLALWSAIASLLVSIYWGGRYILLTRRLHGAGQEDDSDDDVDRPADDVPGEASTEELAAAAPLT